MTFTLTKASDLYCKDGIIIEIDSLEDLQNLQNEYHEQLIIDFEEKSIKVYYYYIE